MSELNVARLIEQLKHHEGYRSKPYTDTTGHLTIGYGTNLDDGLDRDEAEFLLRYRLRKCIQSMPHKEVYNNLSAPRKEVLVRMCYNLGAKGLGGFKRMWVALSAGLWEEASKQMLDSLWARQVGVRAERLAEQMRTGEYVHID